MAAFQSDASGFLVGGTPLGTDQATKLLSGIKGDTRRILEAMRSLSLERSRRASGGRAPLQVAGGASYSRAVTAGGRAMSTARELARDPSTGRFVSSLASPTEQRMTRSAEIAARAMHVVARVEEDRQRNDKLNSVARKRNKDGTFAGGDPKDPEDPKDPKESRGGDSRLLQASATAIDGAERIDPLIGAAGEVKQFAQFARNIAAPVLGAGRSLFRRKKQTDEAKEQKAQTGFLKRILKRLGGKSGDDSGGGLLSMLPFVPALLGMLPAVLPVIMAAVPALLGGAAVAILAVFREPILKFVSDAADWVKNGMKAIPGVGSLVRAVEDMAGGTKVRSNAPGLEGEATNAAIAAGSDPNKLLRILGAESGGIADPFSAQSKTSSANGVGQITRDTWRGAIRRYGTKYAGKDTTKLTDEEADKLRGDRSLQLAMAAELAGEAEGDARRFSRRNKVQYEDAQTRAMYALGGRDGSKVLQESLKSPSTMLSDLLSADVIKANPFMAGMSVGDLMTRYRKEMSGTTANATGIKRMGNPFKSPLTASQSLTSAPMARAPSMLPDVGPVPSIEGIGSGRVSSSPPAPVRVEVPANLGQDVRDRDIAHIATGGIGNAQTRR